MSAAGCTLLMLHHNPLLIMSWLNKILLLLLDCCIAEFFVGPAWSRVRVVVTNFFFFVVSLAGDWLMVGTGVGFLEGLLALDLLFDLFDTFD